MASAPRPSPPWTLGTALMATHGTLALALVAVLILGGDALRRIDRDLRDLRDNELGALDEQESMHRAMWSVEVALRHADDACQHGALDAEARAPIVRALDALRERDRHVGRHVGAEMRHLGVRYETIVQEVLSSDLCVQLRAPDARARRLALDERLTDLWIEQSFTLHHEIGQREHHARVTGRRSLIAGVLLSFVVVVIVAGLARWLARAVANPLARIAHDATRLGRGDFSPIAPVVGPAEVVELANDLERMRHALAALDSLKQGFVASVSHELRTPLAKIREALSLLEDGAAGTLSPRQLDLVGIARRACESQIDLVGGLLDLSRLRAGALVQMHADGAIEDVVHSAIAAERDDAMRRNVRLTVTVEGHGFARAMDAKLLERAVANLVRNAVHASPEGAEVRVHCAESSEVLAEVAQRAPQGVRWVCVRVDDDGPGVSPEARATLFQPFATAPVAGSTRVGVGLGLTLAREVARAHGGDVVLVDGDHTATRGASFALWIPLVRTHSN